MARRANEEIDIGAEVDALLGDFGVIGDVEGSFEEEAPVAQMKTGERNDIAPSGDLDALWGGGKKKK